MNNFPMARALVAAAVTVLAVAGCSSSAEPGSGTPSSATVAQDHNDADIRFAQGMIPHHQQAVEMAQLAPTRAQSPKVQDLAKRIQAAQDPEIKTMAAWLQRWGAPPASTGMDHGSMGHAGSGMMSAEQMGQLDQARGVAFDRLFLQMMVEHHKGAIEMSNAELRDGRSDAAKQLAQTIINAQQAEIIEMQALLQQLSPAPAGQLNPAPGGPSGDTGQNPHEGH